MARERILVTVKTYPELSRKYGETVCTAGLRPDGTWMRIYPVPFRRLGENEQYRKFDWIECNFVRNDADPRPESHCPIDVKGMQCIEHMSTEGNWRQRRELILGKARVFTRMDELIEGAKSNRFSLAVFKPTRVHDFLCEAAEEREWNPGRVAEMRRNTNQGELFSEEEWRNTFRLVKKLPYAFSYRFADETGRISTLQILDWETGMLYWNSLKSAGSDERIALQRMKGKYLDEFSRTNLHFFLGTTLQWHFRAPNPWVIVGVLAIPHEHQMDLDFGVT